MNSVNQLINLQRSCERLCHQRFLPEFTMHVFKSQASEISSSEFFNFDNFLSPSEEFITLLTNTYESDVSSFITNVHNTSNTLRQYSELQIKYELFELCAIALAFKFSLSKDSSLDSNLDLDLKLLNLLRVLQFSKHTQDEFNNLETDKSYSGGITAHQFNYVVCSSFRKLEKFVPIQAEYDTSAELITTKSWQELNSILETQSAPVTVQFQKRNRAQYLPQSAPLTEPERYALLSRLDGDYEQILRKPHQFFQEFRQRMAMLITSSLTFQASLDILLNSDPSAQRQLAKAKVAKKL